MSGWECAQPHPGRFAGLASRQFFGLASSNLRRFQAHGLISPQNEIQRQ